MLAATWIQVLKAMIPLSGAYILAFLVMRRFHFSVSALFAAVANSKNLGRDNVSAVKFRELAVRWRSGLGAMP